MIKLFKLFIIGLLIISSQVPYASSEAYITFGGQYSSADINKGDRVQFIGSIYNNDTNQDSKVLSMNVSLTLPDTGKIKYNISKTYDDNRQSFPQNSTFTDVLTQEMDYEPGSYNISIAFVVKSTEGGSSQTDIHYVLANSTMLIRGINSPQQVLYGILIIVSIAIVAFIIITIQGRRK